MQYNIKLIANLNVYLHEGLSNSGYLLQAPPVQPRGRYHLFEAKKRIHYQGDEKQEGEEVGVVKHPWQFKFKYLIFHFFYINSKVLYFYFYRYEKHSSKLSQIDIFLETENCIWCELSLHVSFWFMYYLFSTWFISNCRTKI